jgi:sugar-specific transcriptional regulator TrmB
MDIAPFENIGLTNAEIKVYLALLEIGQTKVGKIIERSSLQSSVVHNCIHSLTEKGLVSYIKKGKIKNYTATSPNHFIDFIDEKKKNFEKILPELIIKQKSTEDVNEAEIYEGFKGVMNMLTETIEDSKKGEDYCFFSAEHEPMNDQIQKFFMKFDPKRKEKGLVVRGIAPFRLKNLFVERIKNKVMDVRFTSQPIPPNLSIFRDTISMFTWGEKPIGYRIHSKQIAEKYKRFFYSIWDSLK